MEDSAFNHYDILIIGAGPAGLAMAGRLRSAGMSFHIIEKSDRVACRWHYHYDRLHLHTVKRRSHLPHLPFPEGYPQYVSRQQLVDYFTEYASRFDIKPEFGVEALSVSRTDNGYWQVITNKDTKTALHVVIATGVNNRPNRPGWPGEEAFRGRVIHSVEYRNPEPFAGRRVLVVGMGNTGAEIALDLAEHGTRTWISVRSPVSIVPRDLLGQPVQESGRLLEKLPFDIGAWIGASIQGLFFGDLSKHGLRKPALPPALQLRKTAKTPVVDIGTVRAIKDGRIHVTGEVRRLFPEGVVFTDGEALPVDDIILATGYRPQLRQVVENVEAFLDPLGYPRSPVGTGYHSGLYFIGFNNYALGGILGTIYSESEAVLEHLRGHVNV